MKFEIELKAKPGDRVWVMYDNVPYNTYVINVYIKYTADNIGGKRIIYNLARVGVKTEKDIFLTKDELLDSLR